MINSKHPPPALHNEDVDDVVFPEDCMVLVHVIKILRGWCSWWCWAVADDDVVGVDTDVLEWAVHNFEVDVVVDVVGAADLANVCYKSWRRFGWSWSWCWCWWFCKCLLMNLTWWHWKPCDQVKSTHSQEQAYSYKSTEFQAAAGHKFFSRARTISY